MLISSGRQCWEKQVSLCCCNILCTSRSVSFSQKNGTWSNTPRLQKLHCSHLETQYSVFLLLWTAKHLRYVLILWEPLCASHVFFILIQLEFHSHQLIVNNYPSISESTDTIFSIFKHVNFEYISPLRKTWQSLSSRLGQLNSPVTLEVSKVSTYIPSESSLNFLPLSDSSE